MTGKREAWAGVAVALILTLAGCGGGGDGGGKSRNTTTGIPPTPASAKAPKVLSQPIRPRCGTSGFKERVGTLAAPNQKIWQLTYQVPGSIKHPPRPGQTATVVIIEQTPTIKFQGFPGGVTKTVAGRRVSLKRNPRAATPWSARWKTGRAFYTGLANGNTSTVLERFIACLP